MKNDKWVKRWVVPSSRGGQHIMAEDHEGNFGCSCVGWTGHFPRKDCVHIRGVKAGEWPTEAEAMMRRMEGENIVYLMPPPTIL